MGDPLTFEILHLLLLVVPLIALTIGRRVYRSWQQTFVRYAGERAACGLPGHVVARRLLDAVGLSQVTVSPSRGANRYRPSQQQVCLHGGAFDDNSLSALVVAAHEVGHAQQFADGYLPAQVWRALKPLLWLLAVAGIVLLVCDVTGVAANELGPLSLLPAFVVSLALMLDLLLLEYDANRRAKELVRQAALIVPGEERGFNLMLNVGMWMHLGRASSLVAALVLMGLMHLLANMEWFPENFAMNDAPGNAPPVVAAPVAAAPVVAVPQPAMPQGPQEVVNIELDIVTPLLYAAGVVALSAAVQLSRRVRASRAVARCSAAVALQKQGAFEAAIVEYDAAVRLDRKRVAAYVGRAVHLHLGQLDEALADLETANRLMPGVAGLLVTRGAIHQQRGDMARALADFNEALRLIPDSAQALVCRGSLWLAQHELELAEADFDRAIELNPHDAIAFNNRGVALMKRGDHSRAEADFHEAIRLDPALPNPHQHLAELEADCPVS